MEDVLARSPGLPARRLLTAAFTAFALLAVVLSAIGLFGVAAHDVACRRTELTLRVALGADPMRILRGTLGRGVVMVGIGLALGSVLSIGAVDALKGVIFTTGLPDVVSIAAAAMVLLATGVAAVLPAALRASRTTRTSASPATAAFISERIRTAAIPTFSLRPHQRGWRLSSNSGRASVRRTNKPAPYGNPAF